MARDVVVPIAFASGFHSSETSVIFEQLVYFLLQSGFESTQFVLGERLLRYEFFKFSNDNGMNSNFGLASSV